jgi:hypothetical protein
MSKDKLDQMVSGIYDSTTNGTLQWKIRQSVFNSDTCHGYEAISPDGITKFRCEVSLNNDMTVEKDKYAFISVKNPNMIDGGMYLYNSDYPLIQSIFEWIYNNHICALIKVPDQDKAIDDILGVIGKSGNRDRKIGTLLEKKSLFKRLFGK